jgi:biopolymer transport protein ExbD
MGSKLKGHARQVELNLTAVMNIFLILIPFLLLTAVFVRISVLELSLPRLDRKRAASSDVVKPKSVVLNILLIKETGFELKSPNLKFSPITKRNDTFDYVQLDQQLQRIKSTHPDSEDIMISPEDTISYDTIIQVMDRCRDSGFGNISISA